MPVPVLPLEVDAVLEEVGQVHRVRRVAVRALAPQAAAHELRGSVVGDRRDASDDRTAVSGVRVGEVGGLRLRRPDAAVLAGRAVGAARARRDTGRSSADAERPFPSGPTLRG